jgi:transglutaminase-like putative cysteine protease
VKYRIVHKTEYVYEEPVTSCHNEAHLTPRALPRQRVTSHAIDVEPKPATMSRRKDWFGNPVLYFAVQSAHPALTVTARSFVERDDDDCRRYQRSTCAWNDVATRTRASTTPDGLDARQFLCDSPMLSASSEVRAYAQASFPDERPMLEAVTELTLRIHADFGYEPGTTTIATPLARVLAQRSGVCQDFAHVAIASLRSMGLAARYVSGYLETLPPPGEERLVGADASHAWFAVWDPDAGWLDFDPTNGDLALARHITTAWGRDYGDVTPMKGIIFGGGTSHIATVAVDVEPVAG